MFLKDFKKAEMEISCGITSLKNYYLLNISKIEKIMH
jgi:hypothetical protein